MNDNVWVAAGPLTHLLVELNTLVIDKNEGYAGRDTVDPWANYRGATAFGLTALDSALCRFNEKHNRAAVLYSHRGNDKVGESLRTTLMDAAAIALIAVSLLDEGRNDEREADHYRRWLGTLDQEKPDEQG